MSTTVVWPVGTGAGAGAGAGGATTGAGAGTGASTGAGAETGAGSGSVPASPGRGMTSPTIGIRCALIVIVAGVRLPSG